jgi:hypothetical protein
MLDVPNQNGYHSASSPLPSVHPHSPSPGLPVSTSTSTVLVSGGGRINQKKVAPPTNLRVVIPSSQSSGGAGTAGGLLGISSRNQDEVRNAPYMNIESILRGTDET